VFLHLFGATEDDTADWPGERFLRYREYARQWLESGRG